MTIRYVCAECASVLKIKDELAGTGARCPKCKTKFVVPGADVHVQTPVLQTAAGEEENSAVAAKETTAFTAPINGESGDSASSRESDSTGIDKKLPFDTSHEGRHALQADAHVPSQDDAGASDDLSMPETEIRFPIRHDSDSDLLEVVSDHQSATNEPFDGEGGDYSVDDDLDSPSVLVGVPLAVPVKDSNPQTPESKRNRTIPLGFQNTPKREIPTANNTTPVPERQRDEAFDPMNYLMDDSPARGSGPLPASNMHDDSDLSLSDDSDYDLVSRPSPLPEPRRSTAPISSRPTPEKIDLASAAKMMKKAIKDAQSDATRQRKINEKPGFDYLQIFREIGLQGLGIIVGCFLLVGVSMYLGNLVVRNVLKTPKLGYVRGTIKLDGQPLANANIFFSPREITVEGSNKQRARTSVGVSDRNGHFTMMYVLEEKIEGVAVGSCRVWVDHIGPKGNDVPAEWSQQGMKEFEVKPGSKQYDFEIAMKSEPKS